MQKILLYMPTEPLKRLSNELKLFFSHSQKGRMVPEYDRDDIREVFHHPYRIIYLIKDQEKIIEILSVIHGARLLPEEIEKL